MQMSPHKDDHRQGVLASERDGHRDSDPQCRRWFSRDNYVADLICTEPLITDSDALRLLGDLEAAHCRYEVDEVHRERLRLISPIHSSHIALAERKRSTNVRMTAGRLAIRISADSGISEADRDVLIDALECTSSLESLIATHGTWYRLRSTEWTDYQAHLLKRHLVTLYQRLTIA